MCYHNVYADYACGIDRYRVMGIGIGRPLWWFLFKDRVFVVTVDG